MEKSNLITEKLEQLAELSKLEGEVNTQIIIYSSLGSRCAGSDGLLAEYVQKFVKEILMTKLKSDEEGYKASQN